MKVLTSASKPEQDVFAVNGRKPESYLSAYCLSAWETENLTNFINNYGYYLRAPSSDMSAVFFSNRLSRFLAYIHWCQAKSMDIYALWDSMTLYLINNEEKEEPAFYFHCTEAESQCNTIALRDFYETRVTPLFQQVGMKSGVRMREFWGQVYHAVPYFLNLIKVTETKAFRERIDNEWRCFIEQSNGRPFGMKKPPFQFTYLEIPSPNQDEVLYTKPTCCLAYKSSNPYCYRCPRMKKEERLKQLRATQSTH